MTPEILAKIKAAAEEKYQHDDGQHPTSRNNVAANAAREAHISAATEVYEKLEAAELVFIAISDVFRLLEDAQIKSSDADRFEHAIALVLERLKKYKTL